MNKRITLNLIGQLCTFACSIGISFFLTTKLYHKNGEKSVVFNLKSLVNMPLLVILQSAKVCHS